MSSQSTSVQSLAWSNEVTAVGNGNHHHEAAPFLARSHAVMVADVLRHAETVGILHTVYNDENCLHATRSVQTAEVNIGRIAGLIA